MAEGAFSGRTVVVVGAARGIGEATARLFAADGARLVLADLAREVELVASTLSAQFPSSDAVALVGDVSDEGFCAELARGAREHLGRLDVLVAAAGVLQPSVPVVELHPDEWDRVMAVNAKGPFLLARSLVPEMSGARRGSIVMFSSIAGQVGRAEYSAYCASKAAVGALTQALAAELAGAGITVNAIAPGFIDTAMGRQGLQNMADARGVQRDEMRRRREASIPTGRLGTAEEVARTVLFLASEAARYITGACIDINGGVQMR